SAFAGNAPESATQTSKRGEAITPPLCFVNVVAHVSKFAFCAVRGMLFSPYRHPGFRRPRVRPYMLCRWGGTKWGEQDDRQVVRLGWRDGSLLRRARG